MFPRVAIIGCGLIGGSFAMALRVADEVEEVVVFDREAAVADRAIALGIGDRVAPTVADAVSDADLVLVAVPVGQIGAVLATIGPALRSDAVVTDVGSTKGDVVVAARAALGARVDRYVPGHPIAGRERHGPDAAQFDLFHGRRVLLTPLEENDAASVDRIAAAWRACGARVDRLDAKVHDDVLAAVSHLPHLLAYALVAQVVDAADAELRFTLAGAGFRDFTRIAASSPELWRDVALANRAALLLELDDYRARLDALRGWIADGDGSSIERMFATASVAREAWREGD